MDFGPEIDDEAIDALDEPALDRMRTVAHLMDDAIPIPGTDARIGLDPILGILPGAGDGVSALVSLYIVAESAYLGVPMTKLVRMLAYVGVDATVGSVPVLGTVLDAFLKVNNRNVELARQDVERRRERDSSDSAGTPITIDVDDE